MTLFDTYYISFFAPDPIVQEEEGKKKKGEGGAWRGERGGEEEKKEGGRWGWGGVGGKVVKISALSGLLIMWVCGGSNKHLAKEYKDGGYILCLEG